MEKGKMKMICNFKAEKVIIVWEIGKENACLSVGNMVRFWFSLGQEFGVENH